MKLKFTILCFIWLGFLSCKKSGTDTPATALPSAPIAEKNSWIAGVTKEISAILEVVYNDRRAYDEVNAAICSGYYEDERVLLHDLLFPETSTLYKAERFKEFKKTPGIFRSRFLDAMNTVACPLLQSALPSLVLDSIQPKTITLGEQMQIAGDTTSAPLGLADIAIYFPYSENFIAGDVKEAGSAKLNLIKPATIVYTDRDADSGPGRAPALCNIDSNKICYVDVNVDDSFATINPTHIVAIGVKVASGSVSEPTITPTITRVYHGWSKLTKQLDKLISLTGNGGGSEVKVGRISGYLKLADQQVSGFSGDIATIYYTRADIRKARWKRVYSAWDPNWDKSNLEQIYAVYEDDTQGSKTVTGTLSTSVNLPGKPSLGKVQGEIGFKVEVMTQDEIITQRKLDRASFLRDGLYNQGWGSISDANDFLPLTKDWPVYDGGTIWQYTMAWKSY